MAGFFVGDEDSTGALEPDESFRDALTARFGAEAVEANTAPAEDPATTSTIAGGDGSSPLPEPPADDLAAATEAPVVPDLEPTAPVAPEGEGFVIAEGEVAPTDSTPPPAATSTLTPDDLDLNDLFTRWNGGTKPDRASITNLLNFVQQVSSLSPEQQRQLDAVLRNEQLPAQAPAAPQYTTPPPTPSPTTLSDDLSPEARQILDPMVQRMAVLEEQLQAERVQREQANIAAQNQQLQAGIAAASQQFVAEYSNTLTPTDLVLLETRVQQSGQFPFFLQQHRGDSAAAYKALLEATALSDPAIKARVIAAAAAASPANIAADTARQQRASAVAAGGTTKISATSRTAATPAKLDPKDAIAAMTAEIAAASGLQSVNRR